MDLAFHCDIVVTCLLSRISAEHINVSRLGTRMI